MNELIKINYDNDRPTVSARELHAFLGIGSEFSHWFSHMCEYGFSEGTDFSSFLSESTGGRRATDHMLTLDMAKHIAMIQRTPEGKEIRDKLIQLEGNISDLSPELRLLINMELRQKQQDKAIEETNRRIDGIRDVVTLNPNSWRSEARRIITAIARSLGGTEYIREVQADIFKLVDLRAGVNLKTRLTNKRQRMAEEGVCKSKRDKLTQVDIIAEDKKLVEIYLAIIKDMALKHGIDAAGIQEGTDKPSRTA